MAKVETILIDSSKPTQSEIEEYHHLISEMKREIRWMDEKYGEKWDNVAKSDYLRLTSLEEKLDKIQAKYPNYNFKNNETRKESVKMTNKEILEQLKEEKEINMAEIEVRYGTGTQYAPTEFSHVEVPQNLVKGILMEAERSNEVFKRVHKIQTSQDTKLNVGAYQQEQLMQLAEFQQINMQDFATAHVEVVMNRYGTGTRVSKRLIQASNFDVMQHVQLLIGDRLGLTCEMMAINTLATDNKVQKVQYGADADDTPLNAMVKALLKLKPVDRAQAVVVCSPAYFEECVLERDAVGRNQLSYELQSIRPTVMGVPVVVSDALTQGAYVGNFNRAVVACVNIESIKAVDEPSVHAVDVFLNCYLGCAVQMPEAVVRIEPQA